MYPETISNSFSIRFVYHYFFLDIGDIRRGKIYLRAANLNTSVEIAKHIISRISLSREKE